MKYNTAPMFGWTTSSQNNLPAQYRARAQEARDGAEAVADEATRQRLLSEAETWDRMAAYEEKMGLTR